MINRVQGYGEAGGTNGRWACEIRIVAYSGLEVSG